MNKKLSVIAVAVALATPFAAAQAEVTTSARVAWDIASVGGDADPSGILIGDSGQGRLQFDSKSDMGFGRLAFDTRLGRASVSCKGTDDNENAGAGDGNIDRDGLSCSSSLADFRDVYLGINLGPGALSFGRMGGASKNLEKDPFIATFLQARGTSAVHGGSYGSSSFINGLMQYSMDLSGWAVKVQYNLQNEDLAAGGTTGKGGDAGLSVKGKAGPATIWLGWNNGGGGDNDLGYTKLGFGMPAGPINLTVNYNSKEAPDGGDADNRIFIDGNMKFGDWMGDVALGTKSHGDASGTYIRLAGKTKLDKQMTMSVGYVQDSTDPGTTGSEETTISHVGVNLTYSM